MITLDDLQKLHACATALDAFAAAFPAGTASWEEVAAHPDCRPEWRGYAAVYAPNVPAKQRTAWIEASNDPPYWRGRALERGHDLGGE